MPANLTNPRPDIVYLRRRLKRGESLPAETTNVTASSTSLNLRGERDKKPARIAEEAAGVRIPETTGISVLKKENDAYRLNKRQSAIGSLLIGNAMLAGWQTQDGASGYLYSQGVEHFESPESKLPEFKNRALIEFQKDMLVVGLRNMKHLKRLIVVPRTNETLQAETVGGSGVVMEFEPFTVLYISVIDSMVEFRKETFRNTITETFGLHTVKSQLANNENPSLRTLFS